ncbi:hypothetical protein WJX81_006368 [Elliptochloris bilobata]|uniref:histidine kinase n=1 Tax=Elliptochloris bilobata TaxID=381761 RepID=A0AAW1RDC1_9CHLO
MPCTPGGPAAAAKEGTSAAAANAMRGPRLSMEALSFLEANERELTMHPITLTFRSSGLEAQFMAEVAKERWPVLIAIFCFDIVTYTFRLGARAILGGPGGLLAMLISLLPQLTNMVALYGAIHFINRRSRCTVRAGYQEELLLSVVIATAICTLLLSLLPERSQDYAFACFFLICTTSLLKIRWLLGTAVLTAPLVLVCAARVLRGVRMAGVNVALADVLPHDADVHLTCAWATGALMSFLADSYRRQMFANAQLARAAAEKEIEEARARTVAQRALADAQAQAAQRALTVAREKAANEAKSEFMSLMCHEVRTPLNGCLASAEMLLETPLGAEQRELAKTIRVSGSILLSTVSNFLDFFKMEAGKQLDVVRTEMDVEELVSDVHCIIEAMIGRGAPVTLLRPLLCGVPDMLLGDPDRLRGILLNLYTNAAKFTKRGAISLRVSVTGPNYRPRPHDASTFCGRPSASPTPSLEPLGRAKPHPNSTLGAHAVSVAAAAKAADAALRMRGGDVGAGPEMGSRVGSETGRQGSGAVAALLSMLGGGSLGAVRAPTSAPMQAVDPMASALYSSAGAHPRWNAGARSASNASTDPGAENADAAYGGPRFSVDSALTQASTADAPGTPDVAHSNCGRNSGSLARGGWLNMGNDSTSSNEASGSGEVCSSADADADLSGSGVDERGSGGGGGGGGGDGGGEHNGMMRALPPAADGWNSVVSRAAEEAERGDRGAAVGTGPPGKARHKQWLVFEVADTGCGVAAEGLRSLFKEYVQGTEDEMRRPRSRGGTGLGLSICSKQVAGLGGHIGAISKPGIGSTFWFTIPLLLPDPPPPCRLPELRRTASWSTRDAYTDGHVTAGQGAEGGGLRTRAATSRAHGFRRFHAGASGVPRCSSHGDMCEAARASTEGGASVKSSPPPHAHEGLDPAAHSPGQRRKSAPERPAGMPAALRGPESGPTPATAAAPGHGSNAGSGGSSNGSQRAAASAIEARALLSFNERNPLGRRSAEQVRTYSYEVREALRRSQDSERLRDSPRGIPAALGLGEESTGEERAEQAIGAQAPDLLSALPDGRSLCSTSRGGSIGSQSLGSLGAVSRGSLSGVSLGGGGWAGGSAAGGGGGARRPTSMRPSMEMRRRKLDTSMLQGRRVLLAEDNLINQTVAKKMLTSLGLQCEVAANGQEAVQRVAAGAPDGRQFDVVLMDMSMPVMGGVEATQVIRRAGMALPIVAMTANASDRDRDECLAAGMDGFLSKPVLKDRLAEAIMLVISGRARYKDERTVAIKSLAPALFIHSLASTFGEGK